MDSVYVHWPIDVRTNSPNYTLFFRMCVFVGNRQTFEICFRTASDEPIQRQKARWTSITTIYHPPLPSKWKRTNNVGKHSMETFTHNYMLYLWKRTLKRSAPLQKKKQRKEVENNMFKSLKAYKMKQYARQPGSVCWWRYSALCSTKTATTVKSKRTGEANALDLGWQNAHNMTLETVFHIHLFPYIRMYWFYFSRWRKLP